MSEKFSAMRNKAVSVEAASSLGEKNDSLSLKQLNYSANQRENQRKSREKIDELDHKKADLDLDNEISSLEISNENELIAFLEKHYPNNSKAEEISRDFFQKNMLFGIPITMKELTYQISDKINNKEEISTADKIKNYKEELTEKGKSQTEILSLLISKFENNESVSVWVENWRNFQKLHQFAKSKPPAEQKAIQNIVAKADFTSESAFSTSLAEISQSKEISNETKFEISREFGGSHIESVDGMNYQLKQVKEHSKAIEK